MILSKIASIVFYLVLFTLTILFAYLQKRTNRKLFGVLAILIPSVAIAARFGVGTDSEAYIKMFDDISREPLSESITRIQTFSMEPIAVFLIKILHHFAFGYFSYFFFFSLLTFGCLYIFSKKIDTSRWWLIFGALVMIMTPYCINGMRQAAAISVFSLLLVRVFSKPRHILSNLALLLLTCCLHFSAAMLIPVLLVILAIKKYDFKKCAAVVMGFSFVSLLIFPKAISFLLENGIMPSKYATTIALYEGSLANFDFIIFLTISVLLLLTRRRVAEQELKLNNFVIITILCNLFYAGLGFYSAYIGRMSDYFWPMATFGIWLGIDRFKDNPAFKQALYIAALAGYFVITYFIMGNSEIIPFRFLS